ncbi:MAG: S-layer homology domain-containing protein, partial [Oscillospiraceae bacterium]|nr:S-layer homology domain-containing protein [Oscillospiraceae bacterium]
MKNMKRALSLVLAMVMLLGMMVIPTGAAGNFKDAAEIKYDEAVEVTSGLGLFAGADGNFMPKGTVTRAQMATIIVKMFHGSQANADTFKRLNGSFSDIASFEGGWAEGYINWCASMGAVAGYGDGTFKPGQAVTTAEAVTMIINAMGIDAGEGQWPLTVMAKADELKLFKDLSPKPDTNKALAREELAVISLNAIQYSADGKIGYEYNGEVYSKYMDAYLAAGQDGSLVSVAKNGSLATDVFGLKTAEGFITGNQDTGLEYTEVKGFIEGEVATYKFDIESELEDIGHYVTVYYSEQYKTEKEPGLAYS